MDGANGRKPILQVENLETKFKTPEGMVYAVNGVSFNLLEGESLGVVGESGCGKSVTMLSLLQLIPSPPGEIANGRAKGRVVSSLEGGYDLEALGRSALAHVRALADG